MLSKEIIVKRLAVVKQLYKYGIDQSMNSEPLNSFSILTFHDSIEMFLKLLSQHKELLPQNKELASRDFMNYWKVYSTLTLEKACEVLNKKRAGIKHHGILLSKSEIEESRRLTTLFFEQNTLAHFEVDFNDIALLMLIRFQTVKDFLIKAQEGLNKSKLDDCIENVAIAFSELLFVYEDSKNGMGYSPFGFGKDLKYESSSYLDNKNKNEKFERFINDIVDSVSHIQEALKINSLGIDYKRYIRFKFLTPVITRIKGSGRYVAELVREKKWTNEDCQYCLDFVIDVALKLQDFDFIIEEEETFIILKQKDSVI